MRLACVFFFLVELQQQLEFAESRCGTLKQQLDYIKMLYKKSEKLHGKQEEAEKAAQGDGNDVGQMVVEVAVKWSDQNLICGGELCRGWKLSQYTVRKMTRVGLFCFSKYLLVQ